MVSQEERDKTSKVTSALENTAMTVRGNVSRLTAVCENLGNTQIFCERVVSCAPKGNQPATPLQTTVRCRSTLTIHIIPYHHISRDLKGCTLRLLDSGWELEDHLCVALSRSCYRWRQIKGRTRFCHHT